MAAIVPGMLASCGRAMHGPGAYPSSLSGNRALASKPAVPHQRPRSPHLFRGPMKLHYRWGPAMLVSILHRATGSGMATVGTLLLVWWLAAIAAGDQAYATFLSLIHI